MSEQVDEPEVVTVPDSAPPRALRRRVESLLAAGSLVAMPTETVYGIAARADHPGAIRALRETKDRPAEVALTWHVAHRRAVESFLPLQPLAARLAARYWPGPLSLILEGVPAGLEAVARDGWTGVRFPAHRATTGMLASLDFPVVMSSANLHGEPPALDAADVVRRFGKRLALVVDGGPSRLGEASGVLRVGRGHFDLLREGLLPAADLRRTAGLRLGFACTGNTCRSPMAEGLARHMLAERLGVRGAARPADATAGAIEDFGFEVQSMGVFAGPGSPASRHAVEVLAEWDIDLSRHASRPALLEELKELDLVYCMTSSHVEALRGMLPPSRARHVELLDPTGGDVPDPIGGSLAAYRARAEHIRECLAARIADWA